MSSDKFTDDVCIHIFCHQFILQSYNTYSDGDFYLPALLPGFKHFVVIVSVWMRDIFIVCLGFSLVIFDLMTGFQSPYRKHHSTESALLNIQNDFLLNMAKGSITALTLLDISATFDTIEHTILLDRLNTCYGINELTFGWFKSYLSEGTH